MITNEKLFNLIFNSNDNSELNAQFVEMISAPIETINAFKFCMDSKKGETLTDEQMSRISSIYNNVFTKIINNLNDKNSIDIFLKIRSISVNNDFLFSEYKNSFISMFMEKRGEIKQKLSNDEIDIDDLSYINEFLNADIKSFILSISQFSEMGMFTNLILRKDPNNLSKYNSIQNLAEKILNNINKKGIIEPYSIVYFAAMENCGIGFSQNTEMKINSYLMDSEKCKLAKIDSKNFSSFSKLFETIQNGNLPEKYSNSIESIFSNYISRLKQNPKETVMLITDTIKNFREPFNNFEKNFMHYIYTNIFKEAIQDLSTTEQLDIFQQIRDASLVRSPNKDYNFNEFVENISSVFKEKMKEVNNKILSGDVDKSELEFLDKFLSTNCIAYNLIPSYSNNMLAFLNIVKQINPEKISDYDCFNLLGQYIVNSGIKNNQINPSHINYLLETIKTKSVYSNDNLKEIDSLIFNNEKLSLTDISEKDFNQFSKLFSYINDESIPEELRKGLTNIFDATFKRMQENPDKTFNALSNIFKKISKSDLSEEEKSFVDSIFNNIIKEASCDFKSIESINNLRKYRILISNLDEKSRKFFIDEFNNVIIKEQISYSKKYFYPKIESGEIDASELKLFDEFLNLEVENFYMTPNRATKYNDFLKIVKDKNIDKLTDYKLFNNAAIQMIIQIRKNSAIDTSYEEFFKNAIAGDKVLNLSNIIGFDREYLKRETDENKRSNYINMRDAYFSRLLDKIKSGDISDSNDLSDIDSYIENYINFSNIKDFYINNPLAFDFISKYAETMLSKDSNLLVTNDAICHLYQFAKSGELPKEMNDSLNNIFENYKSKQTLPNMEKYEKKISLFEPMEKEEFESFVSDLTQLKNSQGLIPEIYCDYLISQKLNENSEINKNIDQYFDLFKRAFEDKAQHILHNNGINNYKSKVTDLKDNVYGKQSPDSLYVMYSEQYLKGLSKNDASILATLFHEIQHAIQNRDMNSSDKGMSALTYDMIKETYITDTVKGFYDKNYTSMQIEIDARLTGVKKQIEFLKSLGMSDVEISNYEAKDLLREGVNKYFEVEQNRAESATQKFDAQGNKRYVDQIFQDVIKENAKKLFEQYPIMGLEFESDGKRKGNLKILSEFAQGKNTNGIPLELCLHILSDFSTIEPEKMQEDAELLVSFNPENEEIKAARDMVLRDTIIPFIEMQTKNGIQLPEMIKNVYAFISANDDLDIFQEQRDFIESKYDEINREEQINSNLVSFDEIRDYQSGENDQIVAEKLVSDDSDSVKNGRNSSSIGKGESDGLESKIDEQNSSVNIKKVESELGAFSAIDSSVTASQRKSAMDFITSQLQKAKGSIEISQINERVDDESQR